MNKKLFALTVSSPDELKANRSILLEHKRNNSTFVALGLEGPQVLVRPFHLTDVPYKDIKNNLKHEAVELLSLPVDDIEFDFQILNKTGNKTFGVFVCLPKKILQEYLSILDKTKLTAIKITASFLAAIDSFFEQRKINNERFFLLGFSKYHTISLAVFNNKQCELLREIPYGDFEEAKLEVIKSLRSASAKSHIKNIDRVYFYGEVAHKDELAQEIARQSNAAAEDAHFINLKKALCSEKNYFNLNLLRYHSFTIKRREQILMAMNIFLFLYLGICILLGAKIQAQGKLIHNLRSSYTARDYDYARNLERQLKLVHYEHTNK